MFGRVTIRLGIGPHSSCLCDLSNRKSIHLVHWFCFRRLGLVWSYGRKEDTQKLKVVVICMYLRQMESVVDGHLCEQSR